MRCIGSVILSILITMSKIVLKQLPAIKLAAETPQKKKRHQLLKTLCDNDFTRAICECCWNVVNKRVKLTPKSQTQLTKHKKILRNISNKSLSLKKRKALIQSGGFASLLPFLIGPIISGITALLRR